MSASLAMLRAGSLGVALLSTLWMIRAGLDAPLAVSIPSALLLLAYPWGLLVGLFRARVREDRSRHAWVATLPLWGQVAAYVVFWGLHAADWLWPGAVLSTNEGQLLAILAILVFLFSFPIALAATLALRRARVLVIVEALGPPVCALFFGLGLAI